MFKQFESAKNRYAKYKVWKAELKTKSRVRYFIVDNVETFSVALVIALIVRQFVVQTSLVYSGSMVPTMAIKDRLIVNKLTYLAKDPKRGDIIVFESPSGDGREFVKRLVGLPNETIEVRDGLIFINDTLTVFPGVRIIRDFSNYGPHTIPDNQYFLWVIIGPIPPTPVFGAQSLERRSLDTLT